MFLKSYIFIYVYVDVRYMRMCFTAATSTEIHVAMDTESMW